MSLVTKEDWNNEVLSLFNYLEFERKLTCEEAQALLRLCCIGAGQPIVIN